MQDTRECAPFGEHKSYMREDGVVICTRCGAESATTVEQDQLAAIIDIVTPFDKAGAKNNMWLPGSVRKAVRAAWKTRADTNPYRCKHGVHGMDCFQCYPSEAARTVSSLEEHIAELEAQAVEDEAKLKRFAEENVKLRAEVARPDNQEKLDALWNCAFKLKAILGKYPDKDDYIHNGWAAIERLEALSTESAQHVEKPERCSHQVLKTDFCGYCTAKENK